MTSDRLNVKEGTSSVVVGGPNVQETSLWGSSSNCDKREVDCSKVASRDFIRYMEVSLMLSML